MYWKKIRILVLAVFSYSTLLCQQDSIETYTPKGNGWNKINKTDAFFKIGGYVKADLIYDFNPINQPDFFDVSKIPTDGSKGTNANLNAKETRLYIDSRIPFNKGVLKTYVEGDFYGESGSFRLRHAYIDINDKFRVGQYWSNFMDEDIIPNTLDFEKPGAYLFTRNVMFRYKTKTSENSYLAIALETPTNKIEGLPDNYQVMNPAPDINARFRYFKEKFHIQISGYVALIGVKDSVNRISNKTLYGAGLSGKINTFKNDHILFQTIYGIGLARYRGGFSTAISSNGRLEPLLDYGITVGYHHQWNDKLYTILVYNYGGVEKNEFQPTSDIKSLSYYAMDLCYEFIKNGVLGIEYLNGFRQDVSLNKGKANRLQFSVKYTFN